MNPTSDPRFSCPITPENTKKIFVLCDDFLSRDLTLGGTDVPVFVCWLDGTVAGGDVSEQVIRPLTDPVRFAGVTDPAEGVRRIESGAVYGHDMTRTDSMKALAEGVAYGACAVLLGGTAFLFQLKTDRTRTVGEPSVEKSVKGSKDSFVEALRVNTAMVRARLRTPDLKLRQTEIGGRCPTAASVLWLEGAAPAGLPEEILRRLDTVAADALLTPGPAEAALADQPRSPFPQLIHTERPDKLAAALTEGRVGLLIDGLPMALAAPATLPEFLRTGEDEAQHPLAAAFLRALRWAALILTLLLPAFYTAVAMYHGEMIPTELLLSVIDSKQSVPFSTPAEILGMLLAFELLQEAGLRLPDPIGQTVSIIGALIVGQSAVDAKVISPIAVIVVALAGIAGYTMPSQDLGTALRLGRFLLTVAAALAGLFGLAAGALLLLWHLCSLESCGCPYVSRTAPKGGTRL